MSSAARILVCEDDEALRYATLRYLRHGGFEARAVATGQECLDEARAWRPALVLLDVRLPDMSGREVCRALKSDPELRRTLVIHQSGVVTAPEAQADALETDADGYLLKPISERTLLAHVRAMLRLRSAESALVDQQERELHEMGERQAVAGAPPPAPSPEAQEELVEAYRALLKRALEERTHRLEPQAAALLHRLAERLYALNAGPRDVVEVHTTAVRRLVEGLPLARAQAFVEEGRLAVLELMGHLLALYRGAGRRPGPQGS